MKEKFYHLHIGPKKATYTVDMKVRDNKIVEGFITHYDKNWNPKSITEIKLGFGRDKNLMDLTEKGYRTLKQKLERQLSKRSN